ncbi:MAG: GTP 3',8-cyclase MoaA, partial [Anaerolineae bacterium]
MTCYDPHRRAIRYLRVSVTDRCNLRCVYCMPSAGVPARGHDEILRYEEIEQVVRAAAALGIHKVRLTGGEPLARLKLVDLVRMLSAIPGIDDLSMTTNGILLSRYAADLKRAGLKRVNVSLDTLRPERYRQITRRGDLADALSGIEAAGRAGLDPVK